MHMQNELLSVPAAGATLTIAAGALAFITRRAKKVINADKLALMGILGAFVFAAQMVNFRLPAMPGTSGHLIGSVLLAVVLGPTLGAIVITSVIIIQCLIFQDGGLLALGCNIINMGLIPCYVGYYIFKTVKGQSWQSVRTYIAVITACIVSLEIGASLVPVQAALSGVLLVPMSTFLITMLGVHAIVGIIEGVVTAGVLGYLLRIRPDIVSDKLEGKYVLSKRAVIASLLIVTVITSMGFSLLASGMPDGLEWSYAERPDQSEFEPIIANKNSTIAQVDTFHERYSIMPDYTKRSSELGKTLSDETEAAASWTSLAGMAGAFITMAFVWVLAQIIRKRSASKPNPDITAA